MPSKLKSLIYPILLSLIVVTISYQNYAYGTILMGFDSWHPEFDFSISFPKTLSVWQEYMGVGAHGAMSFASDLSRNIILFLFSFIFPLSFLRYLWVFLMLGLGVVSMYYFLRVGVFGRDRSYVNELSFLGALFYLYNLSTLQLFYSSFDGFLTHFGFLPLLFLLSKNLLDNYNRRNVIYFLVASFFSSSQAYTGTLFFAFLTYFGIFLLFQSLAFEEKKRRFLLILKIGFLYLLVNLFWLLPVVYFIINGASFISNTTINLFSSEESFLANNKYGGVGDVLILKNFWFDSTDFNNNFGTFDPLLFPWISHLDKPFVLFIGYLTITFILIGLVYSLFKKEYRVWGFLFFVSLFFLSAGREPFNFLFNFFRDYVPLFREAIRFPFTKFSVLASFVFAILFAFGVSFFFGLVDKIFLSIKTAKKISILLTLIFFALFTYRFYPYYEGKLLNPNTKVFMPNEYFESFSYFKNEPVEGRVFLAPADTFWAWPYTSWGYRGSGFVSYGLPQSVIGRSFDVWNKSNESIFWEVRNAVSRNDAGILKNVIEKYKITHFYLDGNIIIPGSKDGASNSLDSFKSLLDKTDIISDKKKFGNIEIYKTKVDSGHLSISKNLPKVTAWRGLQNFDPIFDKKKNYLLIGSKETSTTEAEFHYPYSYLFGVRMIGNDFYRVNDLSLGLAPLKTSQKFENISLQNEIYNLKVNEDQDIVMTPVIGGDKSYGIATPKGTEKVYISGNFLIDLKNNKFSQVKLNTSEPVYLLGGTKSTKYKLDDLYLLSPEIDTCRDYREGSFSYTFKDGTLVVDSLGKNNLICIYSRLKQNLFVSGNVTTFRIDVSKNKFNRLGFCLAEGTEGERKCLKEGVLSEENNYSFTFLPNKKSEEYIFYLYPSFETTEDRPTNAQVRNEFVINEIEVLSYNQSVVSKYSEKENLNSENLVLNSKPVYFSFLNIEDNINFKNYSNLCESEEERLGKQRPSISEKSIGFNFKTPMCVNFFQYKEFSEKYSSGVLAYIKYNLRNDRRINFCSATDLGCLAMDKLSIGSGSGLLPVLSNSRVLRVDLESVYSPDSDFEIQQIKYSNLDLENLGKSFLFNNETYTGVVKNITNNRKVSWLYIVSKNELDSSNILSLHQENYPGWVAICDTSFCKYLGAFNGYGMSWEVGQVTNQVVVIYMPQILLIVGLIVLIIVFFRITLQKH